MSSPILSRRQALAGLSTLILAGSTRAAIAASAPFTQGVASGDPASDGFVLWTRLAPDPLAADGLGGMSAPATVGWTVFSDDALQKPVASGQAETRPDTAHTVHAEVRGLKPDRPYWYRFEALGAQSRVGRARTLPAATSKPEKLSIAYASCSNYEQGYFSAYRHMAAENPDFVLYLGDYIYETSAKPDAKVARRHDQAGPLRTLAAYRNRYALHHLDTDLQDLRAAATALMTWDDHEVQNDYGGFLSQYMRDDVNMPMLRRAAYQAYYEAMPLRTLSKPVDGHARLYKGYRFGNLAEINMLDGRQYRSAAACPAGDARKGHVVTDACAVHTDPARSMLGFEQEKWLYQRFAKSQAAWNVLGQDLLVATYLQQSKDKTPVVGHYTDAWDGYPATRDRLLQAMQATRLKNPVILSGDLHSFWANEIKPSPDAATVATEFLGTSVTSDNPNHALMTATWAENPHVKYLNSRTQGYAAATFTRDHAEVRFMAISDRADPRATVSVEKRFVVENGKPAVITLT